MVVDIKKLASWSSHTSLFFYIFLKTLQLLSTWQIRTFTTSKQFIDCLCWIKISALFDQTIAIKTASYHKLQNYRVGLVRRKRYFVRPYMKYADSCDRIWYRLWIPGEKSGIDADSTGRRGIAVCVCKRKKYHDVKITYSSIGPRYLLAKRVNKSTRAISFFSKKKTESIKIKALHFWLN